MKVIFRRYDSKRNIGNASFQFQKKIKNTWTFKELLAVLSTHTSHPLEVDTGFSTVDLNIATALQFSGQNLELNADVV